MRISRHGPQNNYEFPRHAGFYIATWGAAYVQSNDPICLKAIETLVDSFQRRRLSDGGFLAASVHPKETWWLSDLSWAIDVWNASAQVPKPLQMKMRNTALKTDDAFLRANQKGFPLGVKCLWAAGCGKNSKAAMAMICAERFRQTSDREYRRLILETAEVYSKSPPPENALLFPGTFGEVISLQLEAFRLTRDDKFLNNAERFGDVALKLFWTGSLLPRASSKHDHYEAITRADTLALSLLELSSIRQSPKSQLRFEWIDR